ncbi:MAG: single-stranded DNA-binding protein, partial [Syntrophomonadaceae bacterium]|nr:single-stranded DNA-binding protein [Syntrophomonadaceae bacterium]
MAYLNKVMLIGNLGRDPEIRMTATGRKKVSFSLATSKRYRDAAGD